MKREFGFVSFGRQGDGTYNMVTSKRMLEEKLQKIFDMDSTLTKEITMAKTKAIKLAKDVMKMTPKQLVKLAYSEDATEEKVALKEIGLRVTRAQAVWSQYHPMDKFKSKGDVSDLTWTALLKAWDNENTADDAEEIVVDWMELDAKLVKIVK